jgi:hypothetical protein
MRLHLTLSTIFVRLQLVLKEVEDGKAAQMQKVDLLRSEVEILNKQLQQQSIAFESERNLLAEKLSKESTSSVYELPSWLPLCFLPH